MNVPKHLTSTEVGPANLENHDGTAEQCIRITKAMGQKTRPSVYLLAMNLLCIFGRITSSTSMLCIASEPASADVL